MPGRSTGGTPFGSSRTWRPTRPRRPQRIATTRERIERLARVLEDDRARPERPIDGLDGPVVFVCAEFGIHPSLPIYSGGLGALAGDILKQASDLAVPMVGVGLLYRKGYFQQRVDRNGLQHEYWTQIVPEHLPTVEVTGADGSPLELTFPLFGREVAFHVWRAEVGRVPLYLLDTELDENDPVERWITARLYEGNSPDAARAVRAARDRDGPRARGARNRARRAALQRGPPGARGARARRRGRRGRGESFDDALAAARERCVFTTHTPVPAGNETYETGSFLEAFADLPPRLGIDDGSLPRALPHACATSDEWPGMTPLALRLAPARERGQPPSRRGRPRDVAPALRRRAARRRADHVRHERRPPADVPLRADARACSTATSATAGSTRAADPETWAPVDGDPGRGALGGAQRGPRRARRLRPHQERPGPAAARRGARLRQALAESSPRTR